MNKTISPESLLQFEDALAQIRVSFLATLQIHHEKLGDLLLKMAQSSGGQKEIHLAGSIAHKISGVAGTLQLSELGEVAARAEQLSDRAFDRAQCTIARGEVLDAMSELYQCISKTCEKTDADRLEVIKG
ncbi:Hpt domain-containing protein [Aliiroseovarius subalbicans]|uniref:Hpt domain-containing protein n=1 Tax=Aliiroseovarius subalbicans TaxID=2925840 RepID=UPI001F58529B|nr:Hpt domain-containing protein [Aliiroseovarius subalbicans]MCI2399242.1 Hpt domain-containing protein [Aliiroseovarius subalbicans]